MKRKYLSIASVLFAVSVTANADSPWSIGASFGYAQSPYKGVSADALPMPMLSYEGELFYLRGTEGGAYIINDANDKLSVMTLYAPYGFKPSDSHNRDIKRLDKRRDTMMAGFSYEHDSVIGKLNTSVSGDYLGNSDGIVWDSAWHYDFVVSDITIEPGVGVAWSSSHQNDYYYGVKRNETARSGISEYKPGSSWDPYLELTGIYNLSSHLSVLLGGRYTYVSDEIRKSPMVGRNDLISIDTEIDWVF